MTPIKTIIADWLFDKLSADMGNWFDEIKGNEEEIYNSILATLENGTLKEKITLLKNAM